MTGRAEDDVTELGDPVVELIAHAFPSKWLMDDYHHQIGERAVQALRSAGYRIVHPETMAEDCEDPWVCCIHTPPKDVQ